MSTTQQTKTLSQVKSALRKAGLTGENIQLSGSGRRWEIEIAPRDEYYADDETMDKVCDAIGTIGGYTTGYKAWVLTPNYKDMGDFNDPSSDWHYY